MGIPKDVKLQVRQQCGFGCVVCGLMFWDYEHWNPTNKVRKQRGLPHTAAGITLACPNHHRGKGALMSDEDYAGHVANPRALQDGFAHAEWSTGSLPDIILGSVRCKGGTRILSVDDDAVNALLERPRATPPEELMLGFEPPGEGGGPPRLTCRFFGRDGEVFRIDQNRCIGMEGAWDLRSSRIMPSPDEAVGHRFEVRNSAEALDFALDLIPGREIRIRELHWRKDYLHLIANERGFQVMHGDPAAASGEPLAMKNLLMITGGTCSPLDPEHSLLKVTVTPQRTGPRSISLNHHLETKQVLMDGGGTADFSAAPDARL